MRSLRLTPGEGLGGEVDLSKGPDTTLRGKKTCQVRNIDFVKYVAGRAEKTQSRVGDTMFSRASVPRERSSFIEYMRWTKFTEIDDSAKRSRFPHLQVG